MFTYSVYSVYSTYVFTVSIAYLSRNNLGSYHQLSLAINLRIQSISLEVVFIFIFWGSKPFLGFNAVAFKGALNLNRGCIPDYFDDCDLQL